MKKYETYRVYGNPKKIGIVPMGAISMDYYEVPYTEYRADGTIVCIGTEDFSSESLRKCTKRFDVYCYNGKTLHGAYREGYKRTEWVGSLRTSKNACKIAVARMVYGDNVARVN